MAAVDRNGAFRTRDGVDVAILRLLERNGRASYRELADRVHLSPNAVRQRIERLTRDGVIKGFHADVYWDDAPVEAVIDLRLRPGADDEEFERAAIALEGAQILEHLTGPVHYHLRVAVRDVPALDVLVRTLKRELDVESTTTRIVTRRRTA